MADPGPTVLVTETEYRKAEASFCRRAGWSACARPTTKRTSCRRSASRRATYVVVGARPVLGAAVRRAARRAASSRDSVSGHDGIDKTKATAARSVLHQHSGRARPVGRRTHDAARRAAARTLIPMATSMARHVWDLRRAGNCTARRLRSLAAAASGVKSRASPPSATACRSSGARGRTSSRPRP